MDDAKEFLSAKALKHKKACIQKELEFNMKGLYTWAQFTKRTLSEQKKWFGKTNKTLLRLVSGIIDQFYCNDASDESDEDAGDNVASGEDAGDNIASGEDTGDESDRDEQRNKNRGKTHAKKSHVKSILNQIVTPVRKDNVPDTESLFEFMEEPDQINLVSSIEQEQIRLQAMIDARRKRLQNEPQVLPKNPPKFNVTSGDPSEVSYSKDKTVALPPNSSEEEWEKAKKDAGVTNESVFNKANEALLEELQNATRSKSNYRPLDCGETAPVITRMHKYRKSQQQKIMRDIYMMACSNIETVFGNLSKDEFEARCHKEADKLMKQFLDYKLDVASAISHADIPDS